MALIVQKFGGTSVGSIERIQAVASTIARYHRDGHQIVVTVSAMSGETNRLIALSQELQDRGCAHVPGFRLWRRGERRLVKLRRRF